MAPQVTLVKSDVTTVDSDVLLLKYAQAYYGADEAVAIRLARHGDVTLADMAPPEGDFRLVESNGAVASKHVLFLGTPELAEFRYREMRQFARRAIEIIAQKQLRPHTLSTTVHGAGYGLDIEESFRSLILGFQQGLATHPISTLRQIVFAERNPRRYEVLNHALADVELVMPTATSGMGVAAPPASSAMSEQERKKSVFVAMPFSEEFEDIYQFGIYASVRQCGYVCEKVDESVFAGNIVDRITEGIRSAEFVIADLSQERPNVYLEIGFAWGLRKPVILVAREGQRLHFDVSHHKCLFYSTIGKLAASLEKTIREMFGTRSEVQCTRG